MNGRHRVGVARGTAMIPLGMTYAPEHPFTDEDAAPYYGYLPQHARWAPIFAQAEEAPADPWEAWRGDMLDRFDEMLDYQRTRARAAVASAIATGIVGGLFVAGIIAATVREAREVPVGRPRWR